MRPAEFANDHGDFCTITVEVSAGAAKSEITGTNPWRHALQLRVGAPAKDGEANAELLRFLGRMLSIAPNSMSILKGEKSSLKVVRIPMPVNEVRELLGGR